MVIFTIFKGFLKKLDPYSWRLWDTWQLREKSWCNLCSNTVFLRSVNYQVCICISAFFSLFCTLCLCVMIWTFFLTIGSDAERVGCPKPHSTVVEDLKQRDILETSNLFIGFLKQKNGSFRPYNWNPLWTDPVRPDPERQRRSMMVYLSISSICLTLKF